MKEIKQVVTFEASPHDVFEAFMDEEKHSKFTGSPAKISREKDGEFSIYNGSIQGKNIEIIQDKKIVQTWRYDDWPEGHYSTITLEFEEKEGKTEMTFTQVGVPDDKCEDIKQGWIDYYWEPMKKMLA